ncbi:hypothetical protein IAT38_007468 [Cryptococcus sp. DSM 104549]
MSHQYPLDDVNKLCAELVYQVAYAFYNEPYIILLKQLVHDNVMTELGLAARVGIGANEVRKWLGTLQLHRLVKRYVNKEKVPVPDYKKALLASEAARKAKQPGGGGPTVPETRTRDVFYWYLDYREFADVTKYRLAMMRKGIDDSIRQQTGKQGYQCPLDGRTYDPLDLSHLFDPMSNVFKCEDCGTELVEHDATVDPETNSSLQDKMQRFNVATAGIRDALKAVEGVTIPGVNIVAWIAKNVKTGVEKVEGQETGEDGKKFEVVIGAEEDEEKEKLAAAQREQNALPTWHTHSTVTGQATTLGITDANARAANALREQRPSDSGKTNGDEALALHYELLEDDGEDDEDDEGQLEEAEVTPAITPAVDKEDDDDEKEAKFVTVLGQLKEVNSITEEDQLVMTTEEYEAYAAAMYD